MAYDKWEIMGNKWDKWPLWEIIGFPHWNGRQKNNSILFPIFSLMYSSDWIIARPTQFI